MHHIADAQSEWYGVASLLDAPPRALLRYPNVSLALRSRAVLERLRSTRLPQAPRTLGRDTPEGPEVAHQLRALAERYPTASLLSVAEEPAAPIPPGFAEESRSEDGFEVM